VAGRKKDDKEGLHVGGVEGGVEGKGEGEEEKRDDRPRLKAVNSSTFKTRHQSAKLVPVVEDEEEQGQETSPPPHTPTLKGPRVVRRVDLTRKLQVQQHPSSRTLLGFDEVTEGDTEGATEAGRDCGPSTPAPKLSTMLSKRMGMGGSSWMTSVRSLGGLGTHLGANPTSITTSSTSSVYAASDGGNEDGDGRNASLPPSLPRYLPPPARSSRFLPAHDAHTQAQVISAVAQAALLKRLDSMSRRQSDAQTALATRRREKERERDEAKGRARALRERAQDEDSRSRKAREEEQEVSKRRLQERLTFRRQTNGPANPHAPSQDSAT